MSSFDFEPTAGVLVVKASGLLTEEDARRFADELRVQVCAAREKAGRLRMLVDATESIVRSAAALHTLDDSVFQAPDDRVAIHVSSSLVKLRATKPMANPGQKKIFVSASAARTWLIAHDLHDAAVENAFREGRTLV